MTIEAVSFDLDSTIANTLHRQWMVPEIKAKRPGGPTWDDYSMACENDTPIYGAVTLMRALRPNHHIHIITGRSAGARSLTETWLAGWDIPYDGLHMRPAGDRTANGKYKVATLRSIQATSLVPMKFVLFVEDYPEAAEYITEHTGIPCLLVNANYPADAPHQNENTKGV